MKIVLIVISIFSGFTLCSQDYRTISGKVLSVKDSLPIEFANICVKNQPIGCISNENGEFVFHIPEIYTSDTLAVSNISYNSYEKPLLKIVENNITVYLKEADYKIGEVIVLPDGLTVKKIVENYVKNFRKNYPRQKYYYDVFYRGLMYNKVNKTYQQLIELAAGIMDYGFDDDLNKKRIKINEMRKSIDFINYNNTFVRKLFEKGIGKTNILYLVTRKDFVNLTNPKVKNRTTPFETVETIDISNAELFLDKIIKIDSVDIYCIYFNLSKSKANGINGKIYIRSDDYALIKSEFGSYSDLKPDNKTAKLYTFKNEEFGDNYYYWYYVVNKYQKYNKKYFLKFTKTKTLNLDFAKPGVIGEHIIMVNNIYTRERDYKRIRKKHAEKKDVYLYDKETEYHPEFWEHYNILQTNPLHEKAIRDLEKEKKLEQQFEENGK